VFHAALLAGCGSRWLMDFNDFLFDCAERYEICLRSWARCGNVLSEHRAIAEAAIERKTALAIGLLNDHSRRRVGRCSARSRPAPHGALIGATG